MYIVYRHLALPIRSTPWHVKFFICNFAAGAYVFSALPQPSRLCLHIVFFTIHSDSFPASLLPQLSSWNSMIRGPPLSHTSHFLPLSAAQAKRIRLRYLQVIPILILDKTHKRIFIEFPLECFQREGRKFKVVYMKTVLWISEISQVYCL